MPFDQSGIPASRWVSVKNATTEMIPPHAAMRIRAAFYHERRVIYSVGKPNDWSAIMQNAEGHLINGPLSIPPGGHGFGTMDYPALAAYTGDAEVYSGGENYSDADAQGSETYLPIGFETSTLADPPDHGVPIALGNQLALQEDEWKLAAGASGAYTVISREQGTSTEEIAADRRRAWVIGNRHGILPHAFVSFADGGSLGQQGGASVSLGGGEYKVIPFSTLPASGINTESAHTAYLPQIGFTVTGGSGANERQRLVCHVPGWYEVIFLATAATASSTSAVLNTALFVNGSDPSQGGYSASSTGLMTYLAARDMFISASLTGGDSGESVAFSSRCGMHFCGPVNLWADDVIDVRVASTTTLDITTFGQLWLKWLRPNYVSEPASMA